MRVLPALLFCLPALTQEPTVDDLVLVLAKAETLDGPAVGDDGARSATWRTYELLRARATREQLRALTDHAAPVVRCYAVRALLETEAKVVWLALLRSHMRDTGEVMQFEGCTQARCMAGDVMVEFVRDRKVLTGEQVLDLAETLVQTKSPLYAREWSLRNLRFRDGMLHGIRELARAGDPPAAIALARYGIDKDVEVLIEHLQRPDPFPENCRYLAAEISRDPRLLPALRALVPAATQRLANDNACRLRFWLQAIAAQPGDDATLLLVEFLRSAPATAYKRRDLVSTYEELLAPFAGQTRFASLRQEVAAQRAAAGK
jgi:hypothetical protein